WAGGGSSVYWVTFLALLFIFMSCTKDVGLKPLPVPIQEPESCRYLDDVKPFVLAKCAISGCHVSGFPFGDFSLYDGLKARADNGRIKTLVFEDGLMPPASAEKLTEKEKRQLKCWLDNGAIQD